MKLKPICVTRKYSGAQRLAEARVGAREAELYVMPVSEADAEAVALHTELVGLGFHDAALRFMSRYRVRRPDTSMCPEGPHLIGHDESGYARYFYSAKRCRTCRLHRLAKVLTASHTVLPRNLLRVRVQQSQHRPGAAAEMHTYLMGENRRRKRRDKK